ncbi:hypothetical protein TGRUB_434260 [Toxoplasma gondii RUB]|uniref:Uncharacterized protein n=2 Tax=Toxoplasma gondii TaxID=5811 RepID=A0A086LIW9_TOXGO|nr:hypothetical protein TGRUB_434260 [Toxoplasma gondii RUB]
MVTTTLLKHSAGVFCGGVGHSAFMLVVIQKWEACRRPSGLCIDSGGCMAREFWYCHVSRLLVSDCLMCFCVACRLMVSGWRVAAASRLRCGGEGADFHAEDGVERS